MSANWKPPSDAPPGVQTKVLIKAHSGIVLLGIIFADGTPGIYDFCCDRYLQRDDWNGLYQWMELPE